MCNLSEQELASIRLALEETYTALNDFFNGVHYNNETGRLDTYFSQPLDLVEKALSLLNSAAKPKMPEDVRDSLNYLIKRVGYTKSMGIIIREVESKYE